MTDIVKNELERNVKELERCVELIVPYTNTTEEIIRLKKQLQERSNFESIRMLVDYCEGLSLEGEPAMERWLTSPRLAKLKENFKNEEV